MVLNSQVGRDQIVALAGGVGGAKLASGLALTGLGERLTMIVNTADDFNMFRLRICPDLDTVTYTLAGLANPETGWGIKGDTFNTLDMLNSYGEDPWFQLGDRDFATHILRTARLSAGQRLTEVMSEMTQALGIVANILPMCDQPVMTQVQTADGLLDFQEYFVRRRHSDDVSGVQFTGIEQASISPEIECALTSASGIVICPSNPFVSIDPILSVPGMRQALDALDVPIVAISPIVGGQAVKGPAAAMLASLGHEVSAVGVAEIYRGFIDGFIIDQEDAGLAEGIEELGLRVQVADTMMVDDATRRQLAKVALDFISQLEAQRDQ